jgi:flavin reductase (DIM6/NTAB) family NADH-FMN oxidoreductase RutF
VFHFYDSLARQTGTGDPGLPFNPFKALVAPRPIGWITTLSEEGLVNLAPYSYFQAVSDYPDIVMFAGTAAMVRNGGGVGFSVTERKHSHSNAVRTGEFVCNLATWDLREEMNASSAHFGADISEVTHAGLTLTPSTHVKPPRLAAASAAMECVVVDTHIMRHRDGGMARFELVFGEVVGIHVDERFVNDGRVDTAAMRPIARMGYDEYSVVESAFSMTRPVDPDEPALEKSA